MWSSTWLCEGKCSHSRNNVYIRLKTDDMEGYRFKRKEGQVIKGVSKETARAGWVSLLERTSKTETNKQNKMKVTVEEKKKESECREMFRVGNVVTHINQEGYPVVVTAAEWNNGRFYYIPLNHNMDKIPVCIVAMRVNYTQFHGTITLEV